jgi:hypothetical protein
MSRTKTPKKHTKHKTPKKSISSPATPRKSRRRRLVGIGLGLLLFLVACRLVLWLSLPRILEHTLSDYGLTAQYEQLNLTLLAGDMELWHLTLNHDDAPDALASIEYCRADVSLRTLLRGRLVIRRLEIDGMDASIHRETDGSVTGWQPLITALLAPSSEASESQTNQTWGGPTSLAPPLRLDAFRLQHVHIHVVDASVTPWFESHLDLNLRVSDIGSSRRPTRFQTIVSSRPMLDQCVLEGTCSASDGELNLSVTCLTKGLHPYSLKEYLALAGIEPVGKTIDGGFAGQVKLTLTDTNDQTVTDANGPTSPSTGLGISVDLQEMELSVDGQDTLGLSQLALTAQLVMPNTLIIDRIGMSGGRAHVWRTENGALVVTGLTVLDTEQTADVNSPSVSTDPANPSTSSDASDPLQWGIANLDMRDMKLILHDDTITPQHQLTLELQDLSLGGLNHFYQSDPSRTRIEGTLTLPGVIERLRVAGQADLKPTDKSLDLQVTADGIAPDALAPYLEPLGITSTLKKGQLTSHLQVDLHHGSDQAPLVANLTLDKVIYQDELELFGLDTLTVNGLNLNPKAKHLKINQVEIAGQRLAMTRDKTGNLRLLGFTFPIQKAPDIPSAPKPETPSNPSSAEPPPSANEPAPSVLPYHLELGQLIWKNNTITLTDETAASADGNAVSFNGDFDLTLRHIDIDFTADANASSPGELEFTGRFPGILESASLTGSVSMEQPDLVFDTQLAATGVQGHKLAWYLKPLGIEPHFESGDLHATLSARVHPQDTGLQLNASLQNVQFEDAGAPLFSVRSVDINDMSIAPDSVQVQTLRVIQPRLTVRRTQDNLLIVAGIHPLPQPPSDSKPAPALMLDHLVVQDSWIDWIDHAIKPTSISVGIKSQITLDHFSMGVDSLQPATLDARVRIPGLMQEAQALGQIRLDPNHQHIDLAVKANGIHSEFVDRYLPDTLKLVLKDGRFSTRIRANQTIDTNGLHQADLVISDLNYQDGPNSPPLLAWDRAETQLSFTDPCTAVVIDEIHLSGFSAQVTRSEQGVLELGGLGFGSVTDSPVQTEQVAPTPENEPNTPAPVTIPLPDSTPRSFPDITVRKLDLTIDQLSYQDQFRADADPIVITDLSLTNREPMQLLGRDPQSNPPLLLDITGALHPLVETVAIDVNMAPFAPDPLMLIGIDLNGITGLGLTAIAPELTEVLDGKELDNGRLTGQFDLGLKLPRRHALDFKADRPFGMNLDVKDLQFSNGDVNNVLLGFDELHVEAPHIFLPQQRYQVKRIEILQPRCRIRKQADHINILDLLIKLPAQEAAAEPNDVNAPATVVQVTPITDVNTPVTELRIDQLVVSGLDLSYTDTDVQPPTVIPLKGLDFEMNGFTTETLDTPKPLRFNLILTAGKVDLPSGLPADPNRTTTVPQGHLFQEISATGRLMQGPQPTGWIKGGVSGLELRGLAGLAAQQEVVIKNGVLDMSLDVRLKDNGRAATAAQWVLSDLSISESERGFLSKLFKLPAPLPTVLFILKDAQGAIRIPTRFSVPKDGLSQGQIVTAATGAAGAVIARAVTQSPTRMLKLTTGLLGGSDKESSTTFEPVTVPFEAGRIALSAAQRIRLEDLFKQLAKDKKLQLTLRHQIGAGDIQQAQALVNPSQQDKLALIERLTHTKTNLLQQRRQLLNEAQATYSSGGMAETFQARETLNAVNTQLGRIEQSLDQILEMMRPGTNYAAQRRTRQAAIAMGKARLMALYNTFTGQGLSDRVKIAQPTFTSPQDDSSGIITISLSRKITK